MKVSVSDIKTKVMDEDEDGDITFAIKCYVTNNSEEEVDYITLQGIDGEGFEVCEIDIDQVVEAGESKTLTTRESCFSKKLYNSITDWRFIR